MGSAALKGCGCPWRMFPLRITLSITNLDSGIQSHWSVTCSTVPPCSSRGKELETDNTCGNSPVESQFQEEAWAGLGCHWCWLKWLARVLRRRCLRLISNRCVWCERELDQLAWSERCLNKKLEAIGHLKLSEMQKCGCSGQDIRLCCSLAGLIGKAILHK